MRDHFRFLLRRLRERLWIKPLLACALSVAGVLLARFADGMVVHGDVPEISQDSVIALLKIIADSMLAIATFAVASMVSAYASAGQIATGRAFPLIVADDVSQNALSTYIGTFIFSIVALSATMNGYYGRAGRFTLFVLMIVVLVIVVLTFVRWVDRIARLGRIGAIVAKVEHACAESLQRRRRHPCLGGMPATGQPQGSAFYADAVGYVQHIDVGALQREAVKRQARVTVAALPGAFVHRGRPLGYLASGDGGGEAADSAALAKAFTVGTQRQFDDDPRFGLIVLSEIACRALSSAINDPGTAIGVLGSVQRVLIEAAGIEDDHDASCDRVAIPRLQLDDLFDDAFNAVARDGAAVVEVALRLQRLLGELGQGFPSLRLAARHHAALALARCEAALRFGPDLERVRARHAEYWGSTSG